ncbi:MAG: hypothetical protein ABIJ17_01500 [Patescibacteria group bacterium]
MAKLHIYSSEISDDIELSETELNEIINEYCSLAEMVVRKDGENYELTDWDDIVYYIPFKNEADKGDMNWDYTCSIELDDEE